MREEQELREGREKEMLGIGLSVRGREKWFKK